MVRSQHDCGELARRILSHNPRRMRYTFLDHDTTFEHHLLPVNIGTTQRGDIALTADPDELATTHAELTDDNPPRIRAADTTSRLTYLGVTDHKHVKAVIDPGETTPAYTQQQFAYHLAKQNHAIAKKGITYLAVGDHPPNAYDDTNTKAIIGISNQGLYKATRIRTDHTYTVNISEDIRTPRPRNTSTNREEHATAIDATTTP